MKLGRRIIAAAILSMPLFVVSGCSSDRLIYTTEYTIQNEESEKQSPGSEPAEVRNLETQSPDGENTVKENLESQSTGDEYAVTKNLESQSSGDAQTASENSEEQEPMEQSAEIIDVREQMGYVFLCGEVMEPGVYPIYEDTRLYTVIEQAGGFNDSADCEWLNLAMPLQDGQRIYVYSKEETEQLKSEGIQPDLAGTAVSETSEAKHFEKNSQQSINENDSASGEIKININTADKQMLMTLPGIGEAKAQAILTYREQHGGFERIEELTNISGIKNAVFSKIKDFITV